MSGCNRVEDKFCPAVAGVVSERTLALRHKYGRVAITDCAADPNAALV